MSLVTYNSINLPYAYATKFNQESVYDDSGTDRIYTRFDIEVETVINSTYVNVIAPDLVSAGDISVTSGPAVVMNQIRRFLLQPRRRLQYRVNGVDVIPTFKFSAVNIYVSDDPNTPEDESEQSQNTAEYFSRVDAKNGPQPKYCNIHQLTNETFLVSWGVVAHYWDGLSSDAPLGANGRPQLNTANETNSFLANSDGTGNMMLTNRWQETVDINGCNYTIRTREGKYIIRSDNDRGKIADEIRSQLAIVGVPEGFLRDSSSYTVSEDGLTLTYKIVDREVFKMPPQPAFKASGKYRIRATRLGASRTHEVQITLEGDKKTNQAELLAQAIEIVVAKLAANGVPLTGQNAKGTFIGSDIEVDMYENRVTVSAIAYDPVMFVGPDGQPNPLARRGPFAGINFGKATFTPISDQILQSSHFSFVDYKDRGTADRLLHAAAYWDPNLRAQILGREKGMMTGSQAEVGTAGKYGE